MSKVRIEIREICGLTIFDYKCGIQKGKKEIVGLNLNDYKINRNVDHTVMSTKQTSNIEGKYSNIRRQIEITMFKLKKDTDVF